MTAIEIPPAASLRVSVVVVSFGESLWLQRCLQALVANTDRCYEVIIVDNGSAEATRDVLTRHVSGARVVLNPTNVGFGPACNQGALLARAPLLCFLNPDALVQPGWLPPILDRLAGDQSVGAVVPMFFNWDDAAWDQGFRGTLQEAGCIVGRDGSTQSLGYGDEPGRPWHRFPRRVDYASAACVVLRRTAFEAVGGFDPVFAPGYCEDVDLCFALDDIGWQTAYEPSSSVIHVRGTSITDEARQALLDRNTDILRQRWSSRLADRPGITGFPAFAHRSIAARDALCTGRVLLLGRLEATAAELAGRLPDVRITLVAEEHLVAEPKLLQQGVEVIAGPQYDWADIFERRWFQYDAVITDLVGVHLASEITRTQPQALRVDRSDIPGGLRAAGIAA